MSHHIYLVYHHIHMPSCLLFNQWENCNIRS